MAVTGAKSLLNRLDRLQTAIKKDAPNAIREEVDRGRMKAERAFAAVEEEIHDVKVSPAYGVVHGTDGNEYSWQIIAEGEDVLFVEYGTGILTIHKENDFGGQSFEPGSWSRTHAQYLTDPKKLKAHGGYWPYRREWVKGIDSKNIMYDTSKRLRERLTGNLSVAKRAIGEALK